MIPDSPYNSIVFPHGRRARKALEGNGDLPVFILGHSLGGLIALVAANNSPSSLFRGVLATGPAITVDPDIATPVNIFLARCLMRYCDAWIDLMLIRLLYMKKRFCSHFPPLFSVKR